MQSTRGSKARRSTMLLAVAMAAVLSLGALAGCAGNGAGGAGGSGASDVAATGDNTAKTLVKTAANEMTLVDWDVSAADSPITVSSDDAKYAEYFDTLGEITGFDIESLSMQVRVTEFAGAEIAATHENVKDNMYTIESLDAVVDGKTIEYKDGDFKKKK